MGAFRYSASMSLDGFLSGPQQGPEHPLGIGGEQLHVWLFELAAWRVMHGLEGGEVNASTEVFERGNDGVSAVVMGRNMFGGGPGPWRDDAPWNGWWGDDPPFRVPVFVLTHHERASLVLNDTSFTFVTAGIHEALALARAAAGDGDVALGGGAQSARQYLAAGLLDELTLHVVPAVLGAGVRLFELGETSPPLTQVRAVEAPGVTHLTYRPGP